MPIGQLTGGVAHDFNNMLTVIIGNYRDRWWQRPADAARRSQPSRTLIDEAAERGAELTQHLLAFARRQPLQPRNVDINAAVARLANCCARTLGEQIEIETVLARGL